MSAQFDVAAVVSAVGGKVRSSPFPQFSGVQTDSRAAQSGALFIPLKGDRFDGHSFVAQAIQNGARGVLVHHWSSEYEALLDKATFIEVSDTLLSLQQLAQFWRKKCGFKVIGITGSNGKTSTKEILAEVLRPHFRTHANPGSFNNHWGVPLSLLNASADTEVVVQEMGMNHAGEIRRLCEIAEPDLVVVTMVGSSHVGEVGSIAGIREAKNEIYKYSPKARRVYNLDNEHTILLYNRAVSEEGLDSQKVLTFSSHNPKAQIQLRAGRVTVEGLDISGSIAGVSGQCRVKIFGRHNVVNLMAASALAVGMNVAPEHIFSAFAALDFSSWGRNQWIRVPSRPSILFDGYNANPESMRALLKNLLELEVDGNKAFVFGDMRELGGESERAHREVAMLASQVGLNFVWYMGQHRDVVQSVFKNSEYRGELFISEDFDPQTSQAVWNCLTKSDVVALKASRGSRIERVLNSWGVDGF